MSHPEKLFVDDELDCKSLAKRRVNLQVSAGSRNPWQSKLIRHLENSTVEKLEHIRPPNTMRTANLCTWGITDAAPQNMTTSGAGHPSEQCACPKKIYVLYYMAPILC